MQGPVAPEVLWESRALCGMPTPHCQVGSDGPGELSPPLQEKLWQVLEGESSALEFPVVTRPSAGMVVTEGEDQSVAVTF